MTGYKVYSRDISVGFVGSAPADTSVAEHFIISESNVLVTDSLVYDGRNDVTAATDPSTELNDLEGGSLFAMVGALSEAGESDRSASLDVSTAAPAPTGLMSVSQTTTAWSFRGRLLRSHLARL